MNLIAMPRIARGPLPNRRLGALLSASNSREPRLQPIGAVAVTLAGDGDPDRLEYALHAVAEHTAFGLDELRACPAGSAARWEAVFRLRAVHGVIGDAQIYALLRLMTGNLRWLGVRKEPEQDEARSAIRRFGGHYLGAA